MAGDLALVREWDQFLTAQGVQSDTRRVYRYGVFRFLADVCPSDLTQVREADVTAFLATFHAKASARVTYLRALRSLFGFAHARGRIQENPTALLRPRPPTKPPVTALSEEELARLLEAAGDRHPKRRWAMTLCYALGTRRNELVNICPDDVESDAVLLRVTKGNRPRRVELGPLAREALDELRPWYNGTVLGGISRQTFTHWVHEAAVAAGLPPSKRKAHVLRATFATRLLARGVPVSVVSQLLGHMSVAVTTRYLAVEQKDRERAVGLL